MFIDRHKWTMKQLVYISRHTHTTLQDIIRVKFKNHKIHTHYLHLFINLCVYLKGRERIMNACVRRHQTVINNQRTDAKGRTEEELSNFSSMSFFRCFHVILSEQPTEAATSPLTSLNPTHLKLQVRLSDLSGL